jgi:hypothetical protein
VGVTLPSGQTWVWSVGALGPSAATVDDLTAPGSHSSIPTTLVLAESDRRTLTLR